MYLNDVVSVYGCHSLGLSSIRNSMSAIGVFELNIGDVITIRVNSDGDGRVLTMYDSQFIVEGI